MPKEYRTIQEVAGPLMLVRGVEGVDARVVVAVGREVGPRHPAVAREVLPWIERLIRAAEPYPRPPAGLDTVRWDEIWLIDRSGRFQLHTLSEGQQQAPDSPDDDTDDEDEEE